MYALLSWALRGSVGSHLPAIVGHVFQELGYVPELVPPDGQWSLKIQGSIYMNRSLPQLSTA